MWGKVIGKLVDVCLSTSLISVTALAVVKTYTTIRNEIKGEKKNGGDPK